MAGFVELTTGREFEESLEGQTGIKVFVEDPGGLQDLPALEDPFGAPGSPDLIVCTRRQKQFGGTLDTRIFTVSYSTDCPQEEQEEDDLPRSLSASAELLNIGRGYVSQSSGGGKINQDMYKRIITVNVRITRIYNDFNDLIDKLKKTLGTVNAAAFLGQAKHTFLMNSSDADEFRNAAGNLRWRATHNFELRAPNKGGAPATFGDWFTVWKDGAGFIQLDAANNPLYEQTNFSAELF